jgi:hypothetical protein
MVVIQHDARSEMITTGEEPHGRAFHTSALMFDNTMIVIGGVQDGSYLDPNVPNPDSVGDFIVTGQAPPRDTPIVVPK